MKLSVLVLTSLLFEVAISIAVDYETGKLTRDLRPNPNEKPVGMVGGHNITIDKANYIGAIVDHISSTILGSVVILNDKWVLTAAFNLQSLLAKDLNFRFGSTYADKGGVLVTSSETFIHPKYKGQWDYDIGLSKLSEPLKFSTRINSISLATSLPKNGETVTFTGFGDTAPDVGGFLQQAKLPYVDYKTCKRSYVEEDFTDKSLCTSKDGVGPCLYDYGSPLTFKDKLIGVYSGDGLCGSTRYPAVYADTTKFNDWIKKTIKDNSDSVDDISIE